MRIAWFTPTREDSAIWTFSKRVLEELKLVADVEVWTVREERLVKSPVPVVQYDVDGTLKRRLRDYDWTVYNMGNHVSYHAAVFAALEDRTGVCILHDLVMHHFVAGWYIQHLHRPDLYVAEMERNYGKDARDAAIRAVSGQRPPIWETAAVGAYPLEEPVLRNTAGVVTHSAYACDRVAADTGLPCISLSFPTPELLPELAVEHNPGRHASLRVLFVGRAGRNRGLDHVIRAVSASPLLSDSVQLRVAGDLDDDREYANALRQLVRQAGHCDILLMGRVSEETKYSLYAWADLALNLRYPTMGETSWSLLEAMFAGIPSIVSDVGSYHEIPESVTYRVPAEADEGALRSMLEHIITNRQELGDRGRSARVYAESTYSAAAYAAGLVNFLQSLDQRAVLLEQGRRLGKEMRTLWKDGDPEVAQQLVDTLCRLRPGSPEL